MPDFFPESDKILPLTENDFKNDGTLNNLGINTNSVCVLFFAPWCHHCKSFKPTFIQVAETLFRNKDQVIFASYNCSENKMDKIKFINGFPTIVLFKDNYIKRFDGSRTKDEIIKFVLS
jgi:thiol-disulfide isomerase/thioredoxin